MNNVRWSDDEKAWLKQIADAWKGGSTQQQIGDLVGLPLNTVRLRMLNLGVRFARGGIIMFSATGESVDIDALLAAA